MNFPRYIFWVGVTIVLCCGCGSAERATKASKGTKGSDKAKAAQRERGVSAVPPTFATIPWKIYTPEPGFFVLVDGVEARDESGAKLTTPCEVGLLEGSHALTLVRPKYQDYTEEINVYNEDEFKANPTFEPFTAPAGYNASRFANAAVGEPLALETLNTGGRVFDPFLADGGRTLYFAGERKEGKAVYVARRPTPFDEFGEPELIIASRGADLPASPSVTADGLWLSYTIVDRARLVGIEKVGETFTIKKELRVSQAEDEVWRSAQLSGDGLSVLCMQERKGKWGTYHLERDGVEAPFKGNWKLKSVDGRHPCLTSDGLRQFFFKEAELFRTTRRDPSSAWSEPESVVALELKNFRHDKAYRQFHVSDDEQWMAYTDEPAHGGNLYMVRLSDGPRWGYVPRGKPVEQVEVKVAIDGEPEMEAPTEFAAMPEKMPGKKGLQPLPYLSFRSKLNPLLARGAFNDAESLLATAKADTELTADADILDWDADLVRLLKEFRADIDKGLQQLKPDDTIRFGLVTLKFVKFEGDTVTGKSGDKEITKKLSELQGGDVVALAERGGDKSSEIFNLRAGAFLSVAPKITATTVAARLNRGGAAGREFLDRLARRKLRVVQREFERENIAEGLKLVDQLVAEAPRSATTTEAVRLREGLFTRLEWRPVGGRKWDMTTPGEYIAGEPAGRADSSFLVSPHEYGNFHLSLEWKTVGGAASQGGVYFRYKTGVELRGNSYKLHVGNDAGGPSDQYSTGALLGVMSAKARAVKPEGEWNTLVMRVIGDKLTATINGIEVQNTTLSNPKIGQTGYVCLDGEYIGITYRKVLLYELK